jgi:hypothetical protein
MQRHAGTNGTFSILSGVGWHSDISGLIAGEFAGLIRLCSRASPSEHKSPCILGDEAYIQPTGVTKPNLR